jgi:Cellulase (glycosyl hydrolase family 5)
MGDSVESKKRDFTDSTPRLIPCHMVRILAILLALGLSACRGQVLTRKPTMEWIAIGTNQHGFDCVPSGRQFHPWGNNYGNKGRLIEDFWASEPQTIERDFQEMKRMGANVIRVHLQLGKFMLSTNKLNPDSLVSLGRLLQLAEQTGLYLDLTGLACYRRADVPAWYDQLSESERWQIQARFWEGIAARCANSPAVFCYDLINEPAVAIEKRQAGDWYSGGFGEYNFVQFINLDPAGRTLEQIALPWIADMTGAIRKHDKKHLITVGLLPFNPGPRILGQLDFVSVHIYPESGKIDHALETLREFVMDKPVVIEETFPLSCSAADLKKFLLDSRRDATGWIGHYNGEPIGQLEALQQSGKITLQQTIWLAWLQLFQQMGPSMTNFSRIE